MRPGTAYTAAVSVVALVVGCAGFVVPAARAGVWVGAGIGGATQVLAFWVLFVWLFPHRAMLAYGAGMIVRLTAFALVALLVSKSAMLPAAATLFALVAVFFVSTLLEPLALLESSNRR